MPSAKPSARKRKRAAGKGERLFSHILKLVLSPIVLLWDVLRRKGSLDSSWIYSFMLFMTLLLGLVLISLFITEGPVDSTLAILADASQNREELTGDVDPVIRYINKYAIQNKLDPNLIFAIIKTESRFNPKAVSPAGARGLMQIMPPVWKEFSHSRCSGRHTRSWVCSKECIFNPEANIRVGVKYFRYLLNRYHGRVDLALEAYNAGLSNVHPGEEPKFEETRGYIQKTLRYWQELRANVIATRVQSSLYYKNSIKWLLGIFFLCWLLFFWWMNRKYIG